MKTVTVTWRAFSEERRGVVTQPEASKTIEVDTDLTDIELCEQFFMQTNLYTGPLWDALQPLPADRTHTSLSSNATRGGDLVTIDGRTYSCEPIGWWRQEDI